ncbi:MAG: leucine-rich repeat domain-containing protein [Candidatus Goldbacteria bacterium]|nr:leucine-rich repeat domain-containing protein [Candidatus Goldiibacteriota bacterium]
MKKSFLVFFLLFSVILFILFLKNKNKTHCEKVTFPDANLEAAIRSVINKPKGNICRSDCEKITSLIQCLNSKGINNIQGMQYFKNLQELEMYDNQISDINPLSGLTKLRYLNLSNNKINDISALSGLTDLYSLNLANNQIVDISVLSSLTNLVYLTLSNNIISDIALLSGLLKLQGLYLNNNRIKDISPLVMNCKFGGLGIGDSIDLDGNQLNINDKNIKYLENKGVHAHFCNAAHE